VVNAEGGIKVTVEVKTADVVALLGNAEDVSTM